MGQQFGDTTLTKVFVGGLAWETQKETLREHFEKYGEILEAVIISDKITGRSKGYGFVTFKEPESAKKACEDPSPMINGRRANCNLASLGAKRNGGGGGVRSSPPSTPAPLPAPHHHHPTPGMAVASRGLSSGPPAPWYYHPSSGTPPPPSPFHHHQYQGLLPYYAATYGYTPNYMTDLGYNTHKLGHAGGGGGGGFYQGQFSYPGQAGMVAPNGVLPMYPVYQFHHHHQSQGMGLPAHFYPPATAATGGAMATIPTIITKPTGMASPATTVCMAVEQVTGCS